LINFESASDTPSYCRSTILPPCPPAVPVPVLTLGLYVLLLLLPLLVVAVVVVVVVVTFDENRRRCPTSSVDDALLGGTDLLLDE
jgi:hypothetical protein